MVEILLVLIAFTVIYLAIMLYIIFRVKDYDRPEEKSKRVITHFNDGESNR